MKKLPLPLLAAILLAVFFTNCSNPSATEENLFSPTETQLWEERAASVTIIRDKWGIPHIYGETDADAIFGMMYAQCEDDFKRVETNYITSLGRMAEVAGESALYQDLRQRLFINEAEIKALYEKTPNHMKNAMTAWADGINYYLYKHPEVIPQLITRFEPWMPLTFSEGSIGGDIESISTTALENFYVKAKGQTSSVMEELEAGNWIPEPNGSNGFAIAPSKSATGNALLLINPHTSFFFRSEQHVVSKEGLNAYGAVTWGQYFIYQGFNEHCGWMHTSSAADVIDEFEETIVRKQDGLYYQYGEEQRPLDSSEVILQFKQGGQLQTRSFTVYKSHHGPIIREENGKWVSVALMNDPLNALSQSYMRTKAASYDDFLNTMRLRTNSSNNTVYADDKGNIAYFHGNFMPRRDLQFDHSKPVDGSNPATDWQGLHSINELVGLLNPANGWLQNCNSDPFMAAAGQSPKREHYPSYMARDTENFRGIHAIRVLNGQSAFTLDKLIAAAYDPYLPAFEKLVPSLVRAYDESGKNPAFYGAISILRAWDFRFAESSVATSLAIFWAQELLSRVERETIDSLGDLELISYMTDDMPAAVKLDALQATMSRLEADFGKWNTAWGDINRFQRVEGSIKEPFNDALPSNPIAYVSGYWGALSSYGSRPYEGTKKWYGTHGNSFVAVVEFGDSLKAKAIVTGGQSSNMASPHFNDQAEMYRTGEFRDVLFYRSDIEKVAKKTYRPGEM